jgi:4-diphosphocytidyl-2-C-methyl-D-erythritol kinase
MSGKKTIVVEAPAKVNLYLEVLGERDDGYHEIRSVVVPVSLCDVLNIEVTEDGHIETITTPSQFLKDIGGDCVEDSEGNLVTEAARLLRDKTGYQGGVKVNLEKNIPIGGGLGGGSSDAATVLRALNDLWALNLSLEELMAIGAELGSDIPGLIHGGMVVVEGVGERVNALSTNGLGEIWLVLANPQFEVSTKDIYTRCSSGLTSEAFPFSSMCSCLKEGDVDKVSQCMFNGLQETVFTKYPLIEIVAEDIEKAGAIGVLVSGSGASVFGLARDEKHACEIAERVRNDSEAPVWTKVVRTLL